MHYEHEVVKRQLELAGHQWSNDMTAADNVLAFLSAENDYPGVPRPMRGAVDVRVVIAEINFIEPMNMNEIEPHEPLEDGIMGIIHGDRACDGAHRMLWAQKNNISHGVFIELFP